MFWGLGILLGGRGDEEKVGGITSIKGGEGGKLTTNRLPGRLEMLSQTREGGSVLP